MRVGVVGLGWIGSRHVAVLGRLPNAEVVAVCDSDEERARRTAESAGATAYARWPDLLARESLDALFICTPPRHHRDPAVAALAQGVSVFVEKPIGRTIDDAIAIAAAAETSRGVCAVGYQWHGLDLLDDLRSELEGQRIGLLVGRIFGPTEARPWFLDRAQSGGDVLERASHHIDLARLLGGEIVEVQAATGRARLTDAAERSGADVDDVVSLILHFGEGALGAVHVGWTRRGLPSRHDLEIVASDGLLRLDLGDVASLEGHSGSRRLRLRSSEDPFERSVARFLDAAARSDPGSVFCSAEDAKRTLATALACERATETGRAVPVGDMLGPGPSSCS